MVEVQNLLINVGTKKIPVGSCAIRDTDKTRCRIQRLYPNNLTLHAIEKCLFSILRRRSHINRMQTTRASRGRLRALLDKSAEAKLAQCWPSYCERSRQ